MRPLIILAVSLTVGWFVIGFVGAVDWPAVVDALRRLSVGQIAVLICGLLVRQALNAFPLTRFVRGLSWRRSMQNDLTANLIATLAPPPSDVVLRVSMFKSWGIDPVDGMAGVTLNMLTFYSVRFLAPALGLIMLSAHGFEGGQLIAALASALIAVAVLVGLALIIRGDRLARLAGRTAGRVAARFRSTVAPDIWAASVVEFRGRMASIVQVGLLPALVALVAMVLADATVLTMSIRFVGLGAWALTVDQIIGTFLVAYPLTLLPLSGLGVLDATLIAAFTELAGSEREATVVAALIVWRSITLLGPLPLGFGALGLWRRRYPTQRGGPGEPGLSTVPTS